MNDIQHIHTVQPYWEKAETRGKAREVLVVHSMFNPEVFKMKDEVLMLTKAANRNLIGEVWPICLPGSMVREVWSLCHQSYLGGHRGLEGMWYLFNQGTKYASQDRRTCSILNGICWRETIHRSCIPVGYSERNQYLLTAKDSFSRYCCAYPIPNKEACIVAKVLMDQYFNIYGLPD